MDTADHHGNTALHRICGDETNAINAPDCISVLVSQMVIASIEQDPHHYIDYTG